MLLSATIILRELPEPALRVLPGQTTSTTSPLPSIEHLELPSPAAVKEGLIAFRIAAHIGDTVKYGREAEDTKIAQLRAALDREGQIRCSMDPDRAR
ncbi:MAG: phosphomethylpyrimidine synthase ThiC [Methanoregula sp.]